MAKNSNYPPGSHLNYEWMRDAYNKRNDSDDLQTPREPAESAQSTDEDAGLRYPWMREQYPKKPE